MHASVKVTTVSALAMMVAAGLSAPASAAPGNPQASCVAQGFAPAAVQEEPGTIASVVHIVQDEAAAAGVPTGALASSFARTTDC